VNIKQNVNRVETWQSENETFQNVSNNENDQNNYGGVKNEQTSGKNDQNQKEEDEEEDDDEGEEEEEEEDDNNESNDQTECENVFGNTLANLKQNINWNYNEKFSSQGSFMNPNESVNFTGKSKFRFFMFITFSNQFNTISTFFRFHNER
jgi:TATA-binding protein-associated factor Taf7